MTYKVSTCNRATAELPGSTKVPSSMLVLSARLARLCRNFFSDAGHFLTLKKTSEKTRFGKAIQTAFMRLFDSKVDAYGLGIG